jgi:hypothetical protein
MKTFKVTIEDPFLLSDDLTIMDIFELLQSEIDLVKSRIKCARQQSARLNISGLEKFKELGQDLCISATCQVGIFGPSTLTGTILNHASKAEITVTEQVNL